MQAQLLADLQTGVTFSQNIIADAHAVDARLNYVHPRDIRAFMTEAAVLKLYIAWERYLEQSFVQYLMGSPSTRATVPTCYLNAPTEQHAYKVLLGNQRYVDWSNPDVVVKLSDLYFDKGFPFSPVIKSIFADLIDLRAIRNAAAHLSTTTSAQLDAVALRRLGKALTGTTVYDLVTATPSGQSDTVLQSYVNLLLSAATLVADC